MKKLRLELDQLAVESFDTSVIAARKGTVVAEEQCTCPSACHTYCDTCPGCPTCDESGCNEASCGGSCYPCESVDYYTCGATEGYYSCDASATAGDGLCECCIV